MDASALLIVDLDGPLLDVAPRYWAAHLEALAATGAAPLVADEVAFWTAKRRSAPVAGPGEAYLAAFKAVIERDDLLQLDRVQPGALAALAALAARGPTVVLSMRSNVAGARRTVERLGIAALAPVHFVVHHHEGKVPRARELAAAAGGAVAAVIGDTEADAAVATALAVPFWAVSCGIREEARLRGLGAARVEASLAAYATEAAC